MTKFRFPFGTLQGTCGDKVYRKTRFGNIECALPKHFTTPTDAASINRRKKFKFVTQFIVAIKKLTSLNIIWRRTKERKRTWFRNLFNHLYSNLDFTLSVSNLSLTSKSNLKISNPKVIISSDEIKVKVDDLGKNQDIDTCIEKVISAEGILCLKSPDDSSLPEFAFIPVCSRDKALSLITPLCFGIPVSDNDAQIAKHYNIRQALIVLVTKDEEGMPVKVSETFCN